MHSALVAGRDTNLLLEIISRLCQLKISLPIRMKLTLNQHQRRPEMRQEIITSKLILTINHPYLGHFTTHIRRDKLWNTNHNSIKQSVILVISQSQMTYALRQYTKSLISQVGPLPISTSYMDCSSFSIWSLLYSKEEVMGSIFPSCWPHFCWCFSVFVLLNPISIRRRLSQVRHLCVQSRKFVGMHSQIN
jgi:hypothetical protein